jgi:hypothetical protein
MKNPEQNFAQSKQKNHKKENKKGYETPDRGGPVRLETMDPNVDAPDEDSLIT